MGQFAKLAGGCLIALLIYATPIVGFIKWPLVFLSAVSGALFAFIPFEGRPLDVWVTSFFRSIYRPTEYIWEKSSVEFAFLKTEGLPTTQTTTSQAPQKNLSAKEIALLQSLQSQTDVSQEELDEKATQLLSLFQQTPASTDQTPEIQPQQEPTQPEKEAQFKKDLPFPTRPTQPNIVVGMVLDENNNMIEGAILEIENQNGKTVRAMRSNKLGQFRTVSPLDNGQYRLITEKEGYQFDTMSLKLSGEIIPPIEVKGKKAAAN